MSTETVSYREATLRGGGNAVVPTPPGTPHRPPQIGPPELKRPKKVAELLATHDRILERYDDVGERRLLARKAHAAAEAQDIADDAERVVAGKPPLAEKERAEPNAAAELAELDREILVLTKAGTESAHALAAELHAARDPWLASLEPEIAKCAVAFEDAVAALRVAAQGLAAARGARQWLEQLDPRFVPIGQPGGRVDVRIGRVDYQVGEIIAALLETASSHA